MKLFIRGIGVLFVALLLGAFHSAQAQTSTYSVSATVSGLAPGKSLVLLNRGINPLSVTTNSTVTFSTAQANRSSYSVTVGTQPIGQTCVVSNGTGTINAANVTNVIVNCGVTYSIGGTISGLTTAGLVLKLNNSSSLTVASGSTSFRFLPGLVGGSAYTLSVVTHPPGLTCVVANGAGVVTGSNVTNITVTCTPIVTYTLSGTNESAALVEIAGATLMNTATSTGSFNFTVRQGDSISLTATKMGHACSVVGFSNPTVVSANATALVVNCTPIPYTLSVANPNGATVSIQKTLQFNNASMASSITFNTSYGDSGVSIDASKDGHTCVVAGTSIPTVITGNVSGVTVACTPKTYTITGSNNTGASLIASGSSAATGNGITGTTSFTLSARYGDSVTFTSTKTGYTCKVGNGLAITVTGNVTNADVSCVINTYKVGGSVSGLNGVLVLQNNGGDDLTLSANGVFSFATEVAYNNSYAVTVGTPPTGQTCYLLNNSDIVGAAPITTISVSCEATTYPIEVNNTPAAAVAISGATATNTTPNSSTAFNFSVKYGNTVTLTATKTGNTCTVNGQAAATFTTITAPITGVSVACVLNTYSLSGSNTAGATLSVIGSSAASGNTITGTTNFNLSARYGDVLYFTAIQPNNFCVVSGSPLTVTGNVSGLAVTCYSSAGYTVGGNVFGLSGTLKLKNNNADEITITADGAFVFPTPLSGAATYAVTVSQQPAGQTCQVIGGSGPIAARVWGVVVTCGTSSTSITGGGSVGGMSSATVSVYNTPSNNGASNSQVSTTFSNAGLSFSFPAQLIGSSYSITPQAQTTNLKCVVTNAQGVVTTAAVTTRVECAKPPTADFLYGVVGGTISGLAGTLTLDINGGNSVVVTAGTTRFNFSAPVPSGTAYTVTINTQPSGQTCAVSNGSGTIPSITGGTNSNPGLNDVSLVQVTCVSNALGSSQISGTVVGLGAGQALTLVNGSDQLIVVANGAFTLPTRVLMDAAYAVTVSQPSGQVCNVTGGGNGDGSGVSPGLGLDISNIYVSCATDTRTFTVGGSVTGLTGSLTLLNNGGDPLLVTSNGSFTFGTPIIAGSGYTVTLNAQPTGQTCFLFNNSGSSVTANVTTVSLVCSDNTYQVGGSVTNLSGAGLILQLGKQTITVPSGNASFAFNTALVTGNVYSVFINSQPLGQTCSLSGNEGVMGSTNIDAIVLACSTTGVASYNVVLGRPTDSSITMSILGVTGDWGGSAYVQYGTTPGGIYTNQTTTVSSSTTAYPVGSTQPVIEVNLSGLAANTKYYYRVNYKTATGSFIAGNEYSFTTQRAQGSTFSFGVQGDSHPERYNDKMFHAELYKLTMAEIAKRQPDLYFMLGDDFSSEKMVELFKLANYPGITAFPFAQYGPGGSLSSYAQYQALSSPFVQLTTGEGNTAAKGYGAYLEQRRDYLGLMAHSTSLFTVSGNHEQAMYVNLGGIFNNNAVFSASARNKFYPGPAPVSVTSFTGMGAGFYSGDTESFATGNAALRGYPGVDGDGLLRDYYAFEWGDALFITIDPYWHATSPVDTSLYSDSENTWAKSMGDAQYFWLKDMLERNASAGVNRKKYVFLFSHHINGSGRGGANNTMVGEWGGNGNPDAVGTGDGEFATNRQCAGQPGCLVSTNWPKPVHQLLVDTKDPTGATIFFQAHDHTFARETVDGVVYQSVANPADNSYWSYNCSAYAPSSIELFPAEFRGLGLGQYNANDSVVMPGAGYIHVTVSPQLVKLQYIRTYRSIDLLINANKSLYDSLAGKTNGESAFTYSLPAQAGDDLAANNRYNCKGDAPPSGYVYNHYSVGGVVSGLGSGKFVTLQLKKGASPQSATLASTMTLAGNGAFVFPVEFAGTSTTGGYVVTVASQPAGQTCSVANGSNTIGAYPSGNNVTNVSVTCN